MLAAAAGLVLAVSGPALVASAAPAPGRANPGKVVIGLPQLFGVSCPAASWCMAVGENDGASGAVSGIWDGHAWRWLPNPAPSGKLAVFGLNSVSCVSPASCVAIGHGPFGVPVGVRWHGRSWAFMPWIANRDVVSEQAVSCVTATYCVVSGGADAAHGAAAALLWNGTSWRRLGPAFPAGANAIDLTSVSCKAVASCLAVGSYNAGTATFPLAESWNGSTWTIYAVPLSIETLNAVSCPAVNLCLTVGSTFVRGQGTAPATARWNGSQLTAISAPSPAGLSPALTAVSCGSATNCTAVGNTNVSAPIAEQWTAKSGWTLRRVPALMRLFAVSCSQPTACLATGDSLAGEFANNGTVMRWNGSVWQGIRQGRFDDLAAVSCSAMSACLAIGLYATPSLAARPLTEGWNGQEWRQQTSPDVSGGAFSLTCVRRTFCLAATQGGTVTWNGSTWSPPAQVGGGFTAAACATTRFCVDTNGTRFAVWRGRAWRNFAAPAAPGGLASEIQGVSCASPALCLAFGSYFDSDANQVGAFIDRWNGTTWRLANLPVLANAQLLALSCVPAAWCLAAGAGGFAVRLSAGKWLVGTMPSLATGGLSSMSCASPTMCMVISTGTTARWNGKSWRPGTISDELTGVSCTGPTFCLAVGQHTDTLLTLTERWTGHTWRMLTEPNP